MNVAVWDSAGMGVAPMTGSLPNLIIAGAPKAGTSSLFRWLSDHPQVTGSTEKETCYFADPSSHTYNAAQNFLSGGIEGYARCFPAPRASSRIILEATPGYLYSGLALREIPRLPSRPHIVVLLREPVDQIVSTFRYFRSNWNWIPQDMGFGDFVAACEKGSTTFGGNELAAQALANAAYAGPLEDWRRACGRDRLHIHLFEDMLADKRRFMQSLAVRFGIDPDFYQNYGFPAENQSYAVRSPALQRMNIALRAWLPQGRLYDAVRSVYRLANTRKATAVADPDDLGVQVALANRFQGSNDILARDFGLDLSRWAEIQQSRLARHLQSTERHNELG